MLAGLMRTQPPAARACLSLFCALAALIFTGSAHAAGGTEARAEAPTTERLAVARSPKTITIVGKVPLIPITPATPPLPVPPPAKTVQPATIQPVGNEMDDTNLIAPAVGENALRVLSPTLLELRQITTKAPDPATVTSWNLVGAGGQFLAPAAGEFTVSVGGQQVAVTSVGFRRRVSYAPLNTSDLRIDNALYLTLASPIADGQAVAVTNPDGTIWPATVSFALTADPLRYSPAIHVNQEGYVPSLPKKAVIGYYLGDMGEMPIAPTSFSIIDVNTNAVVFQGVLTLRQDSGYETTPVPYQQVYVADFTAFTTPGEYQLQVEGMGTSLPFLVNEGIAMSWVRTYALGMYEQRSGTAIGLPFTRFAHSADHTAPASVPTPDTSATFAFTWSTINSYTSQVTQNSPPMQFPQSAPALTSNETSLYPFVNTGSVDVSGGHWDAGDYSKYTENSAQLVHELIFAVDNIPGVAAMDNLGIPESGDGIPDALQEAKVEADFLVKMQDGDGGFYFLVYPIGEEYENSLPQNGQSQVVWPKNTSVSAAATAALAEAGSSPAMLKYYPAQAAVYLAAAQKGWTFLQAATSKYGSSRYQKLTFYSDDWQDNDEYAWAAAALFAATGSASYQTQLFALFPNPADPATFRWGWWSMAEGWGNAIRDYAFAAQSGRLAASALNAPYLALCQAQVVAAGDNVVAWSGANAYGTPFPPQTKAVLGGGWYFSLDQASDAAVAYLVSPKPAYIDALVSALNYEGGTNPVNVMYLTGLGLKRQRNIVDQFAVNSRRVLPPSGIPLGQVTAGFEYLPNYGSELSELSYPSDSGTAQTYPYYDRWSDAYNVTQEFITVNQSRSFMATALLASMTTSATGAWTAPAATITVPSASVLLNAPITLTVQVPGMSLTGARVVWEGRDQQPAFGSTYTFVPVNGGDQWVEAEVEWPDGRRAFAESDFQANSPVQVWIDDSLPAGASVGSDGGDSWSWVSSSPAPESGSLAAQSVVASGLHEIWFTGATGAMQVDTGDTLFAWVYLDPANPPSEVMVGWNDGSSWEHRAYWGANDITYGTSGSAGRYYVGALPAAGGWVKLSVPASAVGLEGSAVSGMDFSLFNGRASWDEIGRSSAGQ
jgi:Glycosyl hydrolase family 9/Cellulase N-terminal ig-like domain